MKALYTHARCIICDRKLTVDRAASGDTCDDARCRQRGRMRKTGIDGTRRKRLFDELADVRERVQRHAAPINRPVPMAVLPSHDKPESRLPGNRRDQFRQYLSASIREARERLENPDDSVDTKNRPFESDPSAAELRVMGHACATCRGSCCEGGGDHAFLNSAEIRNRLQEAGAGEDEELLEYYLAQLPEQTITDSCVFHTSAGCALKREARARCCNDYFCGDLSQLWQSLSCAGSTSAFVGAVADERFIRFALIDEQGSIQFSPDGRRKPE